MLTIRTRPFFDTRFDSYFDSFDRAFEQIASSFFDVRRVGPVMDAAWDGNEYVLTVDLPGVPASAVDVEVAGNMLTMSAHTDQLDWKRSMQLGGRLDPEKVTATLVDGRLTVRIGAVDGAAPRKIEISTFRPELESAAQPAIEAQSQDQSEASSQA